MNSSSTLPKHLQKYVVQQDYARYTAEDQAAWRNILRRLHSFLSKNAHPVYAEGIKKSGIELGRIPNIENMSEHLEKFGWRAVAVSGFIPPAAFMELQSLGVLPIACDMRTISHLMYTPAPDIVHEAAGHAPILVDQEFAGYLKRYAKIASNAIISAEDLEMYDAIRTLSDLKEHPQSTAAQIKKAEDRLTFVSKNISHVSEAALLGRMNWWTAEYGLFGKLESPKIFGAGLLSSIGESKTCLSSKVRKIPLSIECLDYSYDITEPQPQLFVTPDFATLTNVLEQFAQTMAFRTGGLSGLEKALAAKSVNTIELDSSLQISGELEKIFLGRILVGESEVAYLKFKGPVQLAYQGHELEGHSTRRHPDGFGSPLGLIAGAQKSLSRMTNAELAHLGIKIGEDCELRFNSGVVVKGHAQDILRTSERLVHIIRFTNTLVTYKDEVLFKPEWGEYDMAIGSKVTSVFGGPADRSQYPEGQSFVAKQVPKKIITDELRSKFYIYQLLSDMRLMRVSHDSHTLEKISTNLTNIFELVRLNFADEWLLQLEIYELALKYDLKIQTQLALAELQKLKTKVPNLAETIDDGVTLASLA